MKYRWLTLALLISESLLISGCTLFKDKAKVQTEFVALKKETIQDIGNTVNNQVWPWILLLITITIVVGGCIIAFIGAFIEARRYLREKPKYEAKKNCNIKDTDVKVNRELVS